MLLGGLLIAPVVVEADAHALTRIGWHRVPLPTLKEHQKTFFRGAFQDFSPLFGHRSVQPRVFKD